MTIRRQAHISIPAGPRLAVPMGAFVLALSIAAASCSSAAASRAGSPGLDAIHHIVVIDLEGWSFDSLYGHAPGADGLTGAGRTTQVEATGVPYGRLPQPIGTTSGSGRVTPDARFPADLPNGPFNIATYAPPTDTIGAIASSFYQEQAGIDGGKMDRFVAGGGAGALPLGGYDATALPLGELAGEYTLADGFFHAAFGGSMLNDFWLISAATPRWADAPASMRAVLGANGRVIKDGAVTPDGFLVNTAYPASGPHPTGLVPGTGLVPPLQTATIGDRLSAKGISWAWYAGGWSDARAGRPAPSFRFDDQPFAYFANYADGTPGQAAHLKDEADLGSAIRTNTLPAVSFYQPVGADSEQPGSASLADGERHTAALIRSLMASKAWASTAVIVTYSDNGGHWDHVPPPLIDTFGPGTRVPTIVISPFAKRGYVDHTTYDTTSILALIEHRFHLVPLGPRDASAADLTNAFTLGGQG
jgi:phospholipase C